jgi:hypothetical protein
LNLIASSTDRGESNDCSRARENLGFVFLQLSAVPALCQRLEHDGRECLHEDEQLMSLSIGYS